MVTHWTTHEQFHIVGVVASGTNDTVPLTPPKNVGPLTDTPSTTLRRNYAEPKADTAACQRGSGARRLGQNDRGGALLWA